MNMEQVRQISGKNLLRVLFKLEFRMMTSGAVVFIPAFAVVLAF
jgi:hypothetical protein